MSDKEYHSAIIKSLPEDMAKFASGILSTACMIDPSKDIDADLLIDHISEEADRVSARTKREGHHGKGKPKGAQDKAMGVTLDSNKKKRRKGKCHNCGKEGHWARECQSPKKDQPSTSQSSPSQALPTSQHSQPPAYKAENKPIGSANL